MYGAMLTISSEDHSDCEWTETHAQLLNMGGFQIVREDGTLSTLEYSQLENSITSSHLHIFKIPVDEIKDRSKGDFIAKMVVVVQTLWFALQVTNRVIQGLSVTELELTTLGHTVLNIFIYWCWWHKPVNVRFPEDRGERGKLERQVNALQRRLPIRARLAKYIGDWRSRTDSWASWQGAVWIICFIVIGGILGAIHCLAWNAHFPTHIESKLWRASAVIVTAAPGSSLLLGIAIVYAFGKWGNKDLGKNCAGLQALVIAIAYALARICLLVLALLSLRALPYDAYVIAPWTIYIPHI